MCLGVKEFALIYFMSILTRPYKTFKTKYNNATVDIF